MSSRVWWTPGPPTQNIWWTSTKFGGLCPPNDGFFSNPAGYFVESNCLLNNTARAFIPANMQPLEYEEGLCLGFSPIKKKIPK